MCLSRLFAWVSTRTQLSNGSSRLRTEWDSHLDHRGRPEKLLRYHRSRGPLELTRVAKIADERLLDLIHKFLKAGYLEDWHWHETWSGAPQGGVLSPLLSNIMLHEFDQYMEETRGANQPTERGHAAKNPAYNRVNLKVNRLSHRIAQEPNPEQRTTMLHHLHDLQEERRRTPSRKPTKRLTFIRYADDWVILLYGYSKEEARAMKATIADWLWTTLKLTLSAEKTLITHWTQRVTFLGDER